MQCLTMTAGSDGDYSEEPARLRNTGFSLCVGCGAAITDQFILRVQPDMEWHARCLKCVKCDQHLDERSTCFVREGRTYCREDYRKLFILRCTRCCQAFARSDYVMKAKNKTYHMECFRCMICHRILQTGEEFALREDGLFCMNDHDKVLPKSSTAATDSDSTNQPPTATLTMSMGEAPVPTSVVLVPPPPPPRPGSGSGQVTLSESSLVGDAFTLAGMGSSPDEKVGGMCGCPGIDSSAEFTGLSNNNNNSVKTPSLSDDRMQDSPTSLSEASQDGSSLCGEQSMSGEAGSTNGGGGTGGSVSIDMGGGGSGGGGGGGKSGKMSSKRSKEQKTTRVRTVLNEKQLHTLRTCYGANPRPDALMKEQLVEMTGLSPRVIRVWFQNKRCKDKKRQILMKQMEHQQQNGGMQRQLQGIPMVASSPIRNDSSISGATPIEIQQFPGPWKTEFAPLGPDIPSDQPPAFQQLMNTFEVGPESGFFGPRSLGPGGKLGLHLPPNSSGGPPEFLHEEYRPTLSSSGGHGGFHPTCPSPHYPVSPCGGIMAAGSYVRT